MISLSSRRHFVLTAITGFLAACRRKVAPARANDSTMLGAPRRAYGMRSPFEQSARYFRVSATPGTGSSRTPLQDLYGIITPSALHFERHHAGVPAIDPAKHRLLVHGLVQRPLFFSMQELRRFPSVSRVHFIECSGNSSAEHAGKPGATPQASHGLVSCSEWTGVPLHTVLLEAGLSPDAKWVIAEGADACRMTRSIPIAKAMDDVIVAYGQNGEALRPEQGYPVRLVVPGWEGNVNIKWLHRLHVAAQPMMSREEAATYTDFMPDGKARRFTFDMQAKSVIVRPAGGQKLNGQGPYEIFGFAWSGLGRITRVEISINGQWRDAQLQDPVLPKAFTAFRLLWTWNGEPTMLASRCTDETGYRQPPREEIVAVRGLHPGPDGFDHYNGIKSWRVEPNGDVVAA